MTKLLIFTDLDGTLMEHESYSIEPAAGALAELSRRQVMPIFNTSKTRLEILAIQEQLNLEAPFICENGAALFNRDTEGTLVAEQVFGAPASQWLQTVHNLREQENFAFEGFTDWNADEVSKLTGLDTDAAVLAKQREYSEPVLWRDTASALKRFEDALASLELQLMEGGRFISIQGNYSKRTAMDWLRNAVAEEETISIALGDSPNDASMLEAADIAVVIKSGKSEQIQLQNPKHIIRTHRPGPAGWHDAIMEILAMLDSGTLNDR